MKILLVKLSSLGDVVHTLPVVQDIRTALPQAQIDWVVEKSFAPLLARSEGLHRVIPCEIRRWRKSFWTAQRGRNGALSGPGCSRKPTTPSSTCKA
jgi:heptosyltransferase-1